LVKSNSWKASKGINLQFLLGPYWPYNGYFATHFEPQSPPDEGYDRDFHVYGMNWTPNGLNFTIDGTVTGVVTPGFWQKGNFPSTITNPWAGHEPMAPFDQEVKSQIDILVEIVLKLRLYEPVLLDHQLGRGRNERIFP
jgi:hypothetical protein